jgi:hypothetical protein
VRGFLVIRPQRSLQLKHKYLGQHFRAPYPA